MANSAVSGAGLVQVDAAVAVAEGPMMAVANVTLSTASVAASTSSTGATHSLGDPSSSTDLWTLVPVTLAQRGGEPKNQEIDVTAVQLSQLTDQNAPETIDTLQIRAEDATSWRAWSSLTVTGFRLVIQTDTV